MRFRSAEAFRPDDAVVVDLETVRGPGRLVRVQDPGEYALELVEWPERDRARLRALLA